MTKLQEGGRRKGGRVEGMSDTKGKEKRKGEKKKNTETRTVIFKL